MTTTSIDIPTPAAEATISWAARLRSEPAVLAALALSLALYYLGPGPTFVVGAVAFFALTFYRPDLQLAMVPLAAPLFYRPRAIGPYFFSLAEFVIVCGVAAWALRDGLTLVRTRSMPALRKLARNRGVWLAGALVLIGALWLLVPDAAHRKVAAYDFWRTVL